MPSPPAPADLSGTVGVILPAAGSSRRFGADKLTVTIAGVSVISRSVRAFLCRPEVTSVVIACDPANMNDLRQALGPEERNAPRLHWCEGGDCRARTVLAGLKWMQSQPPVPRLVAIHDAARPAVSQALIDRVLRAAAEHGAAVPGLAVIDTIKRVGTGRIITQTLPRDELVAVQTPQTMRLDWLIEAYERCPLPLKAVTDDVQLLELAGRPVRVVEGEATNLKVTVPGDVHRLEQILGEVRPGKEI